MLPILLGSIAASPVEYPQTLQGIMETTPERGSNSPKSGEFSGWYDPRILGGQFLDVSLGPRYLIALVYIVLIFLPIVHYPNQRGTSQRNHLRSIGSLYPNRKWLPRLRQVCHSPFNSLHDFQLT